METVFTVTEAKAKFSEIINRIIYGKERIVVTKKGKKVAMVIPMQETDNKTEGLIKAQGVLADLDDELDNMVDDIYKQRTQETAREVDM